MRNVALLFVVLLAPGCASEYEEAARQTAGREAAPENADPEADAIAAVAKVPAAEEPAPEVAEIQPVAGKPPLPSPPPAAPPAAPPAPQRRTGPAIRLSAGVALPQSLPTGTAMGMSVDYAFVVGQPQPSLSYVWVIEPAKADPVRQPVELSRSGTLQAFFTGLRPEHGPFHSHIEGSDGARLSKSLPLQSY
jgi:hypothetical protein